MPIVIVRRKKQELLEDIEIHEDPQIEEGSRRKEIHPKKPKHQNKNTKPLYEVTKPIIIINNAIKLFMFM